MPRQNLAVILDSILSFIPTVKKTYMTVMFIFKNNFEFCALSLGY